MVAPDNNGNEDDVDGCDVECRDSDATPDEELPAAAGGVVAAQEDHADEDEVDGCDLDFNDAEATKDEELPAAVGGVA